MSSSPTACPGPVRASLGDGHLEQILDNLLANALDAVPSGGHVSVSAAATGRAPDHRRRRRAGHEPPAAGGRVPPVRQHQPAGAGLGLAIVHRLVTSNGGSATLSDTPGGGLTVTVTCRASPRTGRADQARRPTEVGLFLTAPERFLNWFRASGPAGWRCGGVIPRVFSGQVARGDQGGTQRMTGYRPVPGPRRDPGRPGSPVVPGSARPGPAGRSQDQPRSSGPQSFPGHGGGAEGNERLTAAAGAALLVLFAAEGFTILSIHQLITLHFFLGMLLIGPVALKIGAVAYRFARYYSGAHEYRRKGPPAPLLRLLGPFVLVTSVGVIGTGVMLAVTGSAAAGPWLFLHKAFFVLWFGVMTIHVLAYVWRLPRLIGSDLRGPDRLTARHRAQARRVLAGRTTRWLLLAASIAGGLLIAAMTVHLAPPGRASTTPAEPGLRFRGLPFPAEERTSRTQAS